MVPSWSSVLLNTEDEVADVKAAHAPIDYELPIALGRDFAGTVAGCQIAWADRAPGQARASTSSVSAGGEWARGCQIVETMRLIC
jgi:hypothetical protein